MQKYVIHRFLPRKYTYYETNLKKIHYGILKQISLSELNLHEYKIRLMRMQCKKNKQTCISSVEML